MKEASDNSTPEQKIIMLTPNLLKVIKKSLSSIRNPHIAKELIFAATKVSAQLQLIKK